MEFMDLLSRVICNITNKIIGHKEIYCKVFNSAQQVARMKSSGSRREGFDMKGSDSDIMLWNPFIHVICEISQAQLYNSQTDDIIFMEHQQSQPGFVLLRPLGPKINPFLQKSLLLWQNDFYISSEMYKYNTFRILTVGLNSSTHGPCTYSSLGSFEFDMAHCFECRHWPQPAISWISRCQNHNWPKSSLLQSIVEIGCHCIAIGAKQSPQEILEWRISFSLAEHKLIDTMTHEQFLCYGLLKLFLKEVLNYNLQEDEKLLCSYFMKTAAFWTIQINSSLLWTAENFLVCFWMCYKLLIKWVYHGYCPNFIIPEDNMFLNKIVGSAQEKLFTQMYELYCEGYKCLRRSKSIFHKLMMLHFDEALLISFLTKTRVSDIDTDPEIVSLLPTSIPLPLPASKILYELCRLIQTCNLSQVQHLMVYHNIIQQIQYYAFTCLSLNVSVNREMYKHTLAGLNILKYTSRKSCMSDIMYLSLYLYRLGKYRQALSVLDVAKSRLDRPYVVYRGVNNKLAYSQSMSGQPMLTKYRQAWIQNITLTSRIAFAEFKLEFLAVRKCTKMYVVASPYALVHFLSVLCYHHLHDTEGQIRSLTVLYTLIHKNDERYIPEITKDVAWQMLGISQQLCGYYSDALDSFHTSLAQVPYNFITEATKQRIRSLPSKV